MASTICSSPSAGIVGKLIVIRQTYDRYDNLTGQEWVNKPGLPISVQRVQSETSILSADTLLVKFLTELLQGEVCTGWSVRYTILFDQDRVLRIIRAVHSIGVSKATTIFGSGQRVHETNILLIPTSNNK
jgi:hypothetical protein